MAHVYSQNISQCKLSQEEQSFRHLDTVKKGVQRRLTRSISIQSLSRGTPFLSTELEAPNFRGHHRVRGDHRGETSQMDVPTGQQGVKLVLSIFLVC